MTLGLTIIAGIAVGLAVGAAFFGGLWWSVRRFAESSHPVLVLALGGLVRFAVALGGFYLAARLGIAALAAALVTFLVVRTVAVRVVGEDSGSMAGPTSAVEG